MLSPRDSSFVLIDKGTRRELPVLPLGRANTLIVYVLERLDHATLFFKSARSFGQTQAFTGRKHIRNQRAIA